MLDSPVPAGADEGVHVALDQGIKASASWESVAGQILSSSERRIATNAGNFTQALEINLGFRNNDDLSNGHRLQDYSTAIADQIKGSGGVRFESLRLHGKRLRPVEQLWRGVECGRASRAALDRYGDQKVLCDASFRRRSP